MNYFVRCLPTLIIGLSLSTTLSLCQGDENADKCLKILNDLDTNILQKIEGASNHKVEEIRTILTGKNEDQRGTLINQLNPIFTSLLPEIASEYAKIKNENKEIKDFVNTVLVPNQVPNSFLCAWILKVKILEDVYRKEGLRNRGLKPDSIFKYADDTAGDQEIIITMGHGKRTLSEIEFIAVLKKLAPGVDNSFLQDLADHYAHEYEFRGEWCYYHDKVLESFTSWKEYLQRSASKLACRIVAELKLSYKNNWRLGVYKFALTMARDHFIGNSIKHYFWEEYQDEIIHNPHKEFDEILDSAFPENWYYTEQNLDHFHLLIRALKKARILQTELKLQYEPFLDRPSVGMPQSLSCRFSKRDFNYFFARWNTTTSTTTTKQVS